MEGRPETHRCLPAQKTMLGLRLGFSFGSLLLLSLCMVGDAVNYNKHVAEADNGHDDGKDTNRKG